MKRSKRVASTRVQAAVDEQEKRMNESWYGKIIPNDYEEYRKLVDPLPEEIANAFKLDVLGRTVTSLYVVFLRDFTTRIISVSFKVAFRGTGVCFF
jgi:hypothetical protein